MTRLQRFEICTHGEYNDTSDYVSWKVVDGIMYFQCTRQEIDWKRNLDIFPAKTFIKGIPAITTRGFEESWQSIQAIIKNNPVTGYTGYSLGAMLAGRAGAETYKKTYAFACPNFLLNPSSELLNEFWNVDFIDCPNDIVSKLPPFYCKGRNKIILSGTTKKPNDVSLLEWLSGHSPKEYRQRMVI